MTQSIEAIYEDGVFKPLQPVRLAEHQPVRLVVESVVEPSRQEVIERLKAKGHLQGHPLQSSETTSQVLSHEELQHTMPRLDPPLSQQILEDRR